MNISDKYKTAFKKAVADTFYDKKIEVWESGTIKDDEGGVIGAGKVKLIDTVDCNFQFKTLEYIQQEYGREIEAEAIVTCSEIKAKIGNIVVFQGVDYEIKAMPPSDTHITMLVKKV